MNLKKYFELAKDAGIESLELYIVKNYSLGFSLFHSEIDSYSLSDSISLGARGIYNGKMGYAYSEKIDKTTPEFVIKSIVENAKNITNDNKVEIFKGSEKYKKFNCYNKELDNIPVSTKLNTLYEIEKKLKESDNRITEIGGVGYEESRNETIIANSYGLKLSEKSNMYVIYAEAVAKDGEDTKTGYKTFFDNDFSKFKVDDFVKDVKDNTIKQLGGKPCDSKKYRAILAPKVVSSLMSALLESTIAEEVQKHSSLFEGKLGTQILSKKITITEKPLEKTIFFKSFDDEGVATYNKDIFKNGVLMTYLYNIETSLKDGVKTTANGYRGSSKSPIKTGLSSVYLKPGKVSEEELIAKCENGIYIDSITGLHAGLNAQSGNFSLQATGFMIRDGKLAEPVNLITVAGNLVKVFQDVTMVANNSELLSSGNSVSSIMIKSIAVSGN